MKNPKCMPYFMSLALKDKAPTWALSLGVDTTWSSLFKKNIATKYIVE